MIQINETNKLKHLNNQYNKCGFLAQSLIPALDDLKESTSPKFQMKKACNDLLKESEKITKEHYQNFQDFGAVENPDGLPHEALDIYQVTAKAYDEAVNFFTERSPNEVVSIMELIRRLEADGVKMNEIAVNYTPILQ